MEFVYFDVVEWSFEAVLLTALVIEAMGVAILAHRWARS